MEVEGAGGYRRQNAAERIKKSSDGYKREQGNGEQGKKKVRKEESRKKEGSKRRRQEKKEKRAGNKEQRSEQTGKKG